MWSKIFLGVLVLFAILFVVGLGSGLYQNDAQPDPQSVSVPNWTSSLSDWLSPSLDPTTLQAAPATCLEAAPKILSVPAGASCKLQVPSSTQKYRKLKLHLVVGAGVSAAYKPASSSDDPNLSKQQLSWPGKDPQSLIALADGGIIAISCGGQAACQLQIQ